MRDLLRTLLRGRRWVVRRHLFGFPAEDVSRHFTAENAAKRARRVRARSREDGELMHLEIVQDPRPIRRRRGR